ncbi:MAG: type II toxin-antitoxin system VapC family toxin [Rubrivivax sp.]|nr:type II toxin-antitoxin system VapC family toxin [Rubrivivax sp.]
MSTAGRARVAVRRNAARKAKPPATPIVLDSSCWMEFFADTERADEFAPAVEAVERLVVPVLTIYEVVKKLAREAGDETAAAALSLMQRGSVVPIDLSLALDAAVNGLPLADSLIYATARRHGAELWTQDAHFEGLAGVRYFAKP